MAAREKLELLFLHALPLDGTMWAGQATSAGCNLCPDALLPGRQRQSVGSRSAEAGGERSPARRRLLGWRVLCDRAGRCRTRSRCGSGSHRDQGRASARSCAACIRAAHASRKGSGGSLENLLGTIVFAVCGSQVIGDAKRTLLRLSPLDIARGVTAFHSRPDRDQFLSAFPRPVVVITGADDVAPGPQMSAAQAASARQGRLHIVPGCGHYVPLERPEYLNSILRGVIAAVR
jgi:pimeloyl-ACP methyl ester carboxylesterase